VEKGQRGMKRHGLVLNRRKYKAGNSIGGKGVKLDKHEKSDKRLYGGKEHLECSLCEVYLEGKNGKQKFDIGSLSCQQGA